MRLLSYILLLLFNTACFAQKNANIISIARSNDVGRKIKMSIDDMIAITAKAFLASANDTSSMVHKRIQSKFDTLRADVENVDFCKYPMVLSTTNLTIQYISFTNNYGTTAPTYSADTEYNTDRLISIIQIPYCEMLHKGHAINTMEFEMDLQVFTLTDLVHKKTIRKETRVLSLEYIKP